MVIVCIVLAITVAGLSIGVPYYREQRVVCEVDTLGGWVGMLQGGPDWLRHLVGDKRMQVFDRVLDVSLCETTITDAGLADLRKLSNLTTLSLEGTDITDAGLAHLRELTNLRYLILERTGVTDAGAKSLQASLPDCHILR